MKVNYDLKMKETLSCIQGYRPQLLLHVCCGPCSSYIVKELSEYFDITIYYSNSNIYPKDEYLRRYNELLYFIERFNSEYHYNIQVVEDPYNNEYWSHFIEPFKHLPEKSMRCKVCYSMRMKKAFDYACANGFDYWTTVLSVSPHKNSQWINEIGHTMKHDHTQFLYADFKKNNGYLKSTQMTAHYEMYRQTYCGCILSYNEMLDRNKKQTPF